MHIEELLQQNIELLKQVAALLEQARAPLMTQVVEAHKEVVAATPIPTATLMGVSTGAEVTPAKEVKPEIDYATMRKELITVDRKEAIALLASFGVAKMPELKREQWSEVHAAAVAVKNGTRSFVGDDK
jgi:predicted NUDIX family NTP pyrophosphohydrolase